MTCAVSEIVISQRDLFVRVPFLELMPIVSNIDPIDDLHRSDKRRVVSFQLSPIREGVL